LRKAIWAVVVTTVFSIGPIMLGLNLAKYRKEKEKAAQAFAAVYEPAKAIFDEKCKTAGERIYKTVEGVEGILLPKIRESVENWNRAARDQMWADAAVHSSLTGKPYIEYFLIDRIWRPCCGSGSKITRDFSNDINSEAARTVGRHYVTDQTKVERAFRYVDSIDAADGKRYRWTAKLDFSRAQRGDVVLQKEEARSLAPRYAVTFDNNVDPDLRKHWIAGTTIKVIDTQFNETMGELEIWNFDRSVGTTQWNNWSTSATVCPSPYDGSFGEVTHKFVDKILKAKQGN
jgi:hypothetical protein